MVLNAPAIVTERMSKRYGSIQALVDLDLSVNHGKIPVSRSDGRYAERVCACTTCHARRMKSKEVAVMEEVQIGTVSCRPAPPRCAL